MDTKGCKKISFCLSVYGTSCCTLTSSSISVQCISHIASTGVGPRTVDAHLLAGVGGFLPTLVEICSIIIVMTGFLIELVKIRICVAAQVLTIAFHAQIHIYP